MEAWYIRHPHWLAAELASLERSYPQFKLDEGSLREGYVVLFGELIVRPSSGTKRHAVQIFFPANSPYAFPTVTPILSMPAFGENGIVQSYPRPEFFDRRHQMPNGTLCLFQYETRVEDGGESIRVVDVLKRAEAWFSGFYSNRWPPDSRESELETHFKRSQAGILLSKTFYSDDLTGSGEYYAVRDIKRTFVGNANHEPPLIATIITVADSVVVKDAREDLQYIFPWIGNEAFTPTEFIESQQQQRIDGEVRFDSYLKVNGHWWELSSEPSVFRNGKGLLDVLAAAAEGGDAWRMVSSALGSDLTINHVQHIALCYPGRSGRREWLFLMLYAKPITVEGQSLIMTDDQKREIFEKARVVCIPAYGLTPKDINLRNETVISGTLSERKVAFFGLGALGSKVAMMLAQAGLTKFKLCDGDQMNVGNTARHVGGLSECGAPKTEVVANRIWQVNPYAEIEADTRHICPTEKNTSEFFQGVDLIICTIADEGAESGFNDLAISIQTPVIYGRAMRRGQMSRVFSVKPGIDACKTCLSIISRENDPDWIAVSERDDDVLLHECGRPVIAGSAVDLTYTASLIARQALDMLDTNLQPQSNHLVWTLRAAPEVSDKLQMPYSVAQSNFLPKPECPSCGHPKISNIEVSDNVRDLICNEVLSSPEVETGGILIGKVEGSKVIVETATIAGPNAIKTSVRFERDDEFCQEQLQQEYDRNPNNVYVGEWHSHLVRTPEPSVQDIRSMSEISQLPNYETDCPVMLICGYDTENNEIGELKAWVFPVSSRIKRVAINGIT